MPKLSSLTRVHPVSVTFEAEGESLTVVFDRNKITPNWIDRQQSAGATGDFALIMASTLEVLISWDVQDEQGQTLPVSAEILSQLPFESFIKLGNAIAEAAMPGSDEGEGSGEASSVSPRDPNTPSTLPLPGTQPTSQNGQEPSPSPTPLASPSPT